MITPTEETSLLDIPSGTVLEIQVQKLHQGHVRLIAVAPDGRYKTLTGNEWNLFAQPLIERNAKGEKLAKLPEGWESDHHIRNQPNTPQDSSSTSPAPKPKNPRG